MTVVIEDSVLTVDEIRELTMWFWPVNSADRRAWYRRVYNLGNNTRTNYLFCKLDNMCAFRVDYEQRIDTPEFAQILLALSMAFLSAKLQRVSGRETYLHLSSNDDAIARLLFSE